MGKQPHRASAHAKPEADTAKPNPHQPQEKTMSYIDGFLIPVTAANKEA